MAKVQKIKVKDGEICFVYLPKAITEQMGIDKGDEVEIKLDTTIGDRTGEKIIVIKKVKK